MESDLAAPLPLLARVECISFPRCGHHLVERMLRRYFGEDRFRYCDLYVDPSNSLDNSTETNFQKNHDLDLETPVRRDRQYLVLVRDPREALVSWFRLQARKGTLEYTQEAWAAFSGPGWEYYGEFYTKWVVRPVPGRLVVDYADLIGFPEVALSQMVEFMSHRPACSDTCRGVVAAERVQPKSRTSLFAFGESPGLEHPALR